jgi:hypothetical protein
VILVFRQSLSRSGKEEQENSPGEWRNIPPGKRCRNSKKIKLRYYREKIF